MHKLAPCELRPLASRARGWRSITISSDAMFICVRVLGDRANGIANIRMIPYGSVGGSIHDPCTLFIGHRVGSYKVKDTL